MLCLSVEYAVANKNELEFDKGRVSNIDSNHTVLAVIGPTACGKTALAVQLAKAMDTEVISCDSMQLYAQMQIGTARPTPKEMDGVPHHLLGICPIQHTFSCAEYVQAALPIVHALLQKGKVPIFCGGTGLYLESLLYPHHFKHTAVDDEGKIRRQLQYRLATQGIMPLYDMLQRVDPDSAAQIHPNNQKRVVRALEIFLSTGKTKTQWDAESKAIPPRFSALMIGIYFEQREVLRARIDARVEQMLSLGLEEEVRSLWRSGVLNGESGGAQAIGYKEWIPYFEGKQTREETIQQIKTATAQYAKRQMTFFRHMRDVHWIAADKEDVEKKALCLAKSAGLL